MRLFKSHPFTGVFSHVAYNNFLLKSFSLFIPAGCPSALLPLLILIEFISYLTWNISLSFRLAVNILSGYLLNIISNIDNWVTYGFITVTPYYLNFNILLYLYTFSITFLLYYFIIAGLKKKIRINFYIYIIIIWVAHVLYFANKLISSSIISNELYCILFFIGLSMMLLNTNSPKENNFIEVLKKIWKNKYSCLLLIIFIYVINILTNILGIGVLIDFTTLDMYLFTLFCKMIYIKLIFATLYVCISGKVDLKFLSITPLNLLLLLLSGYVSFLYIIPNLFVFIPMVKTFFSGKFGYMVLKVKHLLCSIDVKNTLSSLRNVLNSCPVIRNFIHLIEINSTNLKGNRVSPFRHDETKGFKYKSVIMELRRLSKFHPVNLVKPTVDYDKTINLNNSLKDIITWINNNRISIKNKLMSLSFQKISLNIVCMDYNAQFVYNKGDININVSISKKDFFDNNPIYADPIYADSKGEKNYTGESSVYFKAGKIYNSELDYLKYHPNAAKDLSNYTVNCLQTNNTFDSIGYGDQYDEDIEDIFPPDTVTKLFLHDGHFLCDSCLSDILTIDASRTLPEIIDCSNYTDNDKKKLLVGIAKDLYGLFEKVFRHIYYDSALPNMFNSPYQLKPVQISRLDENMYSLLPENLYVVTLFKDCINENAVFKYDKINFFIYAMLLDFSINYGEAFSLNNDEFFTIVRRSLICWLNVSGTHWMSTKDLNLLKKDNPFFFFYTEPSDIVLNTNPYVLLGKSVPQNPFVNYR